MKNFKLGVQLYSVRDDASRDIEGTLKKIADFGVIPAISVKPGTPAEAMRPYLACCDMILVMSVEPGFGGQSFMADMMEKLSRLRDMRTESGSDFLLQVDGGVDLQTCGVCKESGADVLVAGSAYFKAADRAAFVRAIQA